MAKINIASKTLSTFTKSVGTFVPTIIVIVLCCSLPLMAQLSHSIVPKISLPDERTECGTDIVHRRLMETDTVYRGRIKANEAWVQQLVANQKEAGRKGAKLMDADTLLHVCVVVHVIHLGETLGTGTNISDTQINSAISALNDDFRRIVQGFNTNPAGADVKIEFSLALVDPNGLPSTGITRTNGSAIASYPSVGINLMGGNEVAVKALSIWPTSSYYNIWVVSEINDNNGGAGIQGMGYMPTGSAAVDGSIVMYNAFGTTGNLKAFTSLNRVLTHETGHYLSLWHTFQGASCTQTSCTTQGDFCCDTPPTQTNASCISPICAGAMVENYMDYTPEGCKNVFTIDQKARMRAALLGPRDSLLRSKGCTKLTFPLTAFTNSSLTICEGGQVQFQDISSMFPNSWSWSFTGGSPSTSGIKNPLVTYNTAGVYTVTLTTTNIIGPGSTKTATITVIPSPGINGTTSNVTCAGTNTGSINIIANGGTGPYLYFWSTGQTTSAISSLPAGTYTVVVNDSQGCTAVNAFTITSPAAKLAGSVNSTAVTGNCGSCNGTMKATASGGVSPYIYSWSNGQTTQTATGLCGGNYNGVITDAAGCSFTVNGTVNSPASLFAAIPSSSVSCYNSCDATADVTAQGGNPPYNYSWSSPGGGTTKTVSGLCPGSYSVRVTDVLGCIVNISVAVGKPDSLKVPLSVVMPGCNNACDGKITTNVSGGTAPYTYMWSTTATTTFADQLCPDSYDITVTDSKGCITKSSYTIPYTALSANVTGTGAACNANCDGKATVTISGGVPPFKYQWNDASAQTSQTASSLCIGAYKVLVTDANNCPATGSIPLLTTSPFIIDTVITPITCFGTCTGKIVLTPQSGVGPYTYQWKNLITQPTATAANLCAGTYTAIVTDIKGCSGSVSVKVRQGDSLIAGLSGINSAVSCGACNGTATLTGSGGSGGGYSYSWSTGANSAGITNLCAGTYAGTVTDSKGCKASTLFSINESDLKLNAIATNGNCAAFCEGAIILKQSGGLAPYTFNWSNGGVSQDYKVNLCNGTYSITVTDAAGCKAYTQASLSSPFIKKLSISVDTTSVSCPAACNATINTQVSGGWSPYKYNWSNTSTTDSIFGLCSGVYQLTVTDSSGCDTSLIINIANPQPIGITTSATGTCSGVCNAIGVAGVTGGTKPYTYLWSASGGQTSPSAIGLCAGIYTVTVTDAKGCSSTATVTIASSAQTLTTTFNGSDPKCSSVCDGSITANPSGGTSNYSYLWNDPFAQTTATASGLCTGSWQVTITDATGCSVIKSTSLSAPTPLQLSLTGTNENCTGSCDGTATANVTGGVAGYTYLWNDPSVQTSAIASALCAGNWQLTVTDSKGCQITKSQIILPGTPIQAGFTFNSNQCLNGNAVQFTNNGTNTGVAYLWDFGDGNTSASQNPSNSYLTAGKWVVKQQISSGACTKTYTDTVKIYPVPVVSSITISSSCGGLCAGNINLTTTSGTAPYYFLWNTGLVQEDISNLCKGSYSVIVTDANGCTVTTSAAVNEPDSLKSTISIQVSNCGALCNSSATITSQGGAPPYTLLWSNNQTTATVINLCPASYLVTVTDSKGCTYRDTVKITGPDNLVIQFADGNDVICNGNNNGSIFTNVVGGSPAYTYKWSNAKTTPDLTGLSPGTYILTVTDQAGCIVTTSIDIFEPAKLLAPVTVTNVKCSTGCDGSLSAAVTGGLVPYYYSWSPGLEQTPDIDSLCPASYTLTVTDAMGCKIISTGTISQPPTITISTTPTAAACGTVNGSAIVYTNGGTGSFTYSWSNNTTGQTATGLAAGSYTVTATDTNGCTKTDVTAVNNIPAPSITSLTASTLLCNGSKSGTASVIATGGVGSLTYNWSNNISGLTSITGLTAGIYVVSVTDAGGCVAISTVTITDPVPIVLSSTTTNALCNTSNGTATASVVSGGTGITTYLWDVTAASQTTAFASGLAAGTYTVIVTDGNGCTSSTTTTVANTGAGTATASPVNNVTCNGKNDGSATSVLTGGTVSTYLWSSGATTPTVTGLGAGVYNVTITDVNGCVANSTVTINEPTAITNTTSKTDATCGQNNGSITVSTTNGGAGGYSYVWTPGGAGQTITDLGAGSYAVVITDATGCTKTDVVAVSAVPSVPISVSKSNLVCNGANTGTATVNVAGIVMISWSNASTSPTITGLSAGTYVVSVTDANGCTSVSTASITEPAALVPSVSSTQAACGQSNGTVTVTNVTGGTAPYTYVWTPGGAGQTISGLAAGTYDVVISDDNGCTASASTTINNIGGPVLTSITGTSNLCFGKSNGTATVTVTTGTGSIPYTYNWSDGTSAVTSSTSNTISGLASGNYSVTIKDASACQVVSSITISQPTAVAVPTFSTSNAACGKSNGSATASSSGGIGTLTYIWNTIPVQNSATATGLSIGNYIVTVTDVNSCTKTASVTISTSNGPQASALGTPALCNGGNTGTATVTVSNGTGPFTYSWSTGASSVTGNLNYGISGLAANTYSVTITDAKGCSIISTVTLSEPPAIDMTPQAYGASCGSNNGSVTVKISGGTPMYTYSWSNGPSSITSLVKDSISGLAIGNYSITITDANGCSSITTATVSSLASGTLNIVPAQQTISEGGSVSIIVTGGVTYTWYPGAGLSCTNCSNPVATPTVTTTYTVEVADANGCIITAMMTVTVKESCVDETDVFIPNIFSPNGDGKNDILYVEGNGLTNIYWAIYDRWGNLLFESFKQSDGWDGTKKGNFMESGTYVYYLKATCAKTNSEVRLKGNVSIVK